MKDKKAIIVVLLILFLLSGCGASRETTARFQVTNDADAYWTIYRIVDTETGVQYISAPSGGMCVMVDKDGNPLLANGWGEHD